MEKYRTVINSNQANFYKETRTHISATFAIMTLEFLVSNSKGFRSKFWYNHLLNPTNFSGKEKNRYEILKNEFLEIQPSILPMDFFATTRDAFQCIWVLKLIFGATRINKNRQGFLVEIYNVSLIYIWNLRLIRDVFFGPFWWLM